MKVYLVDKWRNVRIGGEVTDLNKEGLAQDPFGVLDGLLARNPPQNGQSVFRMDRNFRGSLDVAAISDPETKVWAVDCDGEITDTYQRVPIEIID